MFNYTLELRTISIEQLFDFDYAFYEESHRKEFERLFYECYRYDEIGFETIGRFKKRLQYRLNIMHRKYSQLYETELACKDISFMLNKDLKETFIRDIEGSTEYNSTSENRESYLDNGVSDVNLTKDLTGVSGNKSDNLNKNNQTEKTELISQGNIGITSSGQLLQDWRNVLINIDEMMIKELKDLFMLIY